MNKEEILKRLTEIATLLANLQKYLESEEEGKEVDVEEVEQKAKALIEEKRNLQEKLKAIDDAKEARNKLLAEIAEGRKGITIKDKGKEVRMEEKDKKDEEQKTYRSAFLKKLQGIELTEEEQRVYQHTTSNTGAVIPTQTAEKIYSQIGEVHPLVADVKKINSNGIFRIIKHTAIVAGDAKVVTEGQKNDDEQNTFVNIILAGKKISKHIEYTMELKSLSVDAFEAYLVEEVGKRIEAELAKQIIASIKDTSKGLVAGNKFEAKTPGTLATEDVLKALGLLNEVGTTFVYANRATVYGNIAAIENKNQTLNFLPDLNNKIAGNLLGNGIKQEDALGAGEVLFLDPAQFILAIIGAFELLRDREPKTGDYIIAGHMIAEGAMTNGRAGALITVGVGA